MVVSAAGAAAAGARVRMRSALSVHAGASLVRPRVAARGGGGGGSCGAGAGAGAGATTMGGAWMTRSLHSSVARSGKVPLPTMPDMTSLLALNEKAVHGGGAPAGALPTLGRNDPALYMQLLPPPTSALVSIAARLGLLQPGHSLEERDRACGLVLQACTHPSYYNVLDKALDLYHRLFPQLKKVDPAPQRQELEADKKLLHYIQSLRDNLQTNSSLATVGHEILGLLSAEYVHLKFPHLSSDVLKLATQAYSNGNTCAAVAPLFGLSQSKLLRHEHEDDTPIPHWNERKHQKATDVDRLLDVDAYFLARTRPRASKRGKESLTPQDANAIAMRSLIGLVYQEQGFDAAKDFVNEYFLSRIVDVSKLLQFTDPKALLNDTCRKFNREKPVARLVAESGRESSHAMYVVAWYTGRLKLGEGFGMSIAMAEHRAATDALRRLYLAQVPFQPSNAPSNTFNELAVSQPAEVEHGKTYFPPRIGTSEALHGIRVRERTWRWRK